MRQDSKRCGSGLRRRRSTPRRVLAGLLAVGAASLFALPLAVPARADVEQMRRDIETLASRDFEGRGIGTLGLDRAMSYLEGRCREAGLAPLGEKGFVQPFRGPDRSTLVNLIGVLGDTAAGNYVILGAHYDHLGLGEPGEPNFGKLHPGADDNASGVAVLLECATRLREAEDLDHAVLFVLFSGEEEGLLGSAAYVDHPALPLDRCVAMVNLDTVGRIEGGRLTVFGAGTARELPRILKGINYGFGFTLQLPEKDPGGSDQASFTRRGISAVQIFSGANADYHRPGDTADKINYDGLDQVAGFTEELLLYLAGRDEPLSYIPPGAEALAARAPAAGGTGRRVSFGSIPDFNDTGDGILLTGVIPESPAAKAGLREGDRIVTFGGVAVEDLRAFSDVLKSFAPGDEVQAVFLRDGKRHEITAVLVARQ